MFRRTLLSMTLLAGGLRLLLCCGSAAPIEADALINACIRTTACGLSAYPRVSNCVDAYNNLHRRFGISAAYDAAYRCVNSAGDCEAVFRCFGTSRQTAGCDTSFQARCIDGKALFCDTIDKRAYSLDCGAAGLGCAIDPVGAFKAVCTPGSCSSSYKSRCDGGRHLSCNVNVIAIEDCQACGQTCNDALGCQGPSRCNQTNDGCNDALDRCGGDQLQSCFDGQWRSTDCAALGLGPCVDQKNGAACSQR
ncbi:MAG: hypothetical protein H6707_09700 [Deltaproteobacteria bacterium]|nr:hypothetical protein [Deltaproteobacteria bacterium]